MSVVIGLLGTCLLLGVLARHSGRFPPGAAGAFNTFVLYVALPALVLRVMHRLEFVPELVVAAVVPWLYYVAAGPFFRLLGPRLGLSRQSVMALVLTGGLGNTAFVGLPMAEALLGQEGLAVAVVADQLGSFMVLSTLATLAATRASAETPLPWRVLARKVATFPPFLALVVSLALRPFGFPVWLDTVLERLGALLTPLALFSVGLQLRLTGLRHRVPALVLGLSYKLLLVPGLVILGLLAMPGLAPMVVQATVLQAAMAPMVSAAILAAEHELDPELAVLMVGVGIPLSFATAPLMLWLVR
ncbi:AEC family transporter [Myxococcus sp. RHSTA-1-4]|uniref:AEC family transporter n=1 Tax=Myxococcus sp. RHSTA-1-4 TaxID=2874601 RepID=UPI001CC1017B|nr:AEC family transporter [Myxococcus sp. RHSTA-1-4]MBZ4418792.1 AEC family transporter [Myxococcus sp. RHSTA-1-4]